MRNAELKALSVMRYPFCVKQEVIMKLEMKKPVTIKDINSEEERQPYTWPKFLTQVFWIFVMLFAMVKIVQAYAS
jgi:hypothetical protein